ncbi:MULTISPECIES: bacteriohemerythrin [Magnetospirillum]|uniref:bacteriohemerythrin n=1 Tax=Magnetospirillum TaxID=13134 RepID=UPI0009ED214A|nr:MULTISPECIES: bacteriohemerythrin [Magnetospirillum]CAA7617677.1 putative Bacteriohemerythrin [Magnetospirillum sp. LM-5]
MSWKEALSVDVVSIDRQHHALINSAEALFAAINAGLTKDALLDGLDQLIEQVSDHFAHEERVMRNIHIPAVHVHERLHQSLLDEVREFREELALGQNERSPVDIERFLNVWLYRHIVEEDKKILDHLHRV